MTNILTAAEIMLEKIFEVKIIDVNGTDHNLSAADGGAKDRICSTWICAAVDVAPRALHRVPHSSGRLESVSMRA
jgi:hypothetical protein